MLDVAFFEDDDKICELFYSNYPDFSWIKAQLGYTINLNESSKNVLIFYTFQGDNVITEFLKNNRIVSKDIRKLFTNGVEEIKERQDLGYNVVSMLNNYNIDIEKPDDIRYFIDSVVNSLIDIIYSSPSPAAEFVFIED